MLDRRPHEKSSWRSCTVFWRAHALTAMLLASGGAWADFPGECECLSANGSHQNTCQTSTAAVRCRYDKDTSSQAPLSLSTLRNDINNAISGLGMEIAFESPMVIESWGGKGNSGGTSGGCSGASPGSGGGRGYARTTLTYDDVDWLAVNNSLYLYLGQQSGSNRAGGSSSVVMGQPITDVTDVLSPATERVFAIASGGGGGGRCQASKGGLNGGDGGCAIATLDGSNADDGADCVVAKEGSNASAAGQDGNGSHSGSGGNQDGDGSKGDGGGQGGKDGTEGIGGYGRKTDGDKVKWVGTPVGDWGYGRGGKGGDDSSLAVGGGGAGGFGGGGGGGKRGSTTGFKGGDGGGGGGGWALKATVDEISSDLENLIVGENGSAGKDTNGDGKDGVVLLTFRLEDTTKNGVSPLLLSSDGRAKGVGASPSADTLGMRARYTGAALLDLDLARSTVSFGCALCEEDGNELAPGLAGTTLKGRPGASNRHARFATDRKRPNIVLDLKEHGPVLDLSLTARRVDIAAPGYCRVREGNNEPVAALTTWLTVDDGTHDPIVLEVLGHWACRRAPNGTMRIRLLSDTKPYRGQRGCSGH